MTGAEGWRAPGDEDEAARGPTRGGAADGRSGVTAVAGGGGHQGSYEGEVEVTVLSARACCIGGELGLGIVSEKKRREGRGHVGSGERGGRA
jgi:hypothetical protein